MEVLMVDHTENPERLIATLAAICYAADLSEAACDRRINKLLDLNHLATLRFASATFLVSGISRACSHQIVRAKHLDFLQESQRYVKQHGASFVYPGTGSDGKISGAYQLVQRIYDELIEAGVRKEDARYVLPNGITTEMYVTGNFQAWSDFLRNRQDKSAQWEIRGVAHKIALHLESIAPTIFKKQGDLARLAGETNQ